MKVFISGADLNFDYDIHSLVSSFSESPEVDIIKNDIKAAAVGVAADGLFKDNLSAGDCGADGLHIIYGDGDITFFITGDKPAGPVTIPADRADRRAIKNALKRTVYQLLASFYDRELPWGTLSGVRPVKIPTKLLSQGMTHDDIVRCMGETYLVSAKKADLAAKVAKKEREILARTDKNKGYSLYIGIPFCPTTCAYCSFTSYPIGAYRDKAGGYIKALIEELEGIEAVMRGRILETIYIGGGTPTSLSAGFIDELMSAVGEIFDLGSLLEYTVEAGRPDSITKEKLETIKSHGADRISVNPQTMNQRTLDLIGRRHTVDDTRRAFYLAREAGFSCINTDFIMGLPGEGYDDLSVSMREAEDLAPDNLTFHSLAVKRAGKIRAVIRDGAKDENDERLLASEITEDHIALCDRTARELGMEPYYLYRQQAMTGSFENTGYSTPGKEGIYNIIMMEEVSDVIAAGAGAVSKFLVPFAAKENHPQLKDIERVANVKNVDEYIARTDEMLSAKQKKAEEIYGT